MAEHASWRGYLKFTVIQVAVALHPATSKSERTRFHLLNKQTGNRLERQLYDPETGKAVDREDQIRGYEIAPDQYVTVEEEELDEIEIESTKVLTIETFVDPSEIDEVYLDGSHYCVPDDPASVEGFALIREAMRSRNVVGIGRVVLSRRERLVLLQPRGKGILVTAVRYPYEVRSDEPVFEQIGQVTVSKDMLELMVEAAARKTRDFDPKQLRDRYEESIVKLLKGKQGGGKPKPARQPETAPKVVNLFEALRRRVEEEREADGATAGSKAKAPSAKRAAKPKRQATKKSKPKK